jgi:hypothetical protein
MQRSPIAAAAVSATSLLSILGLAACATIFNGQTQAVSIQSAPEGAMLSVTNRAGEKIHSGPAPVVLTLKRGAGYFKSETYTVTFSKDGFASKELVISASMSGWYIGNLLLGGVIGMLAVDPVTGGMYVFPDTVNATLDAEATKTSGRGETLKLVSTQSLSAAQLKEGRLLTALQ